MIHETWAVAAAILLNAGKSLHYKDITNQVISSGLSKLGWRGDTPAQTMGEAMRNPNHSRFFVSSRRGWYAASKMAASNYSVLNALGELRSLNKNKALKKSPRELANQSHDDVNDNNDKELIGFSSISSSSYELYPDEEQADVKYFEGAMRQVSHSIFERSAIAREKCLKYYGYQCAVCNFDFEKKYGEIGTGFTHVHHLKQMSDITEEYQIDPIADLRPVCPNCHAMLHKIKPPLSIDDLRSKINQ